MKKVKLSYHQVCFNFVSSMFQLLLRLHISAIHVNISYGSEKMFGMFIIRSGCDSVD